MPNQIERPIFIGQMAAILDPDAFDPRAALPRLSRDIRRDHADMLAYRLAALSILPAEKLVDALEQAIPLLVRLGDFIGNKEGRCEVILALRQALDEARRAQSFGMDTRDHAAKS